MPFGTLRGERVKEYKLYTSYLMNDDNTGIFHVFEKRIGMNEFDQRIFSTAYSALPYELSGQVWLQVGLITQLVEQ